MSAGLYHTYEKLIEDTDYCLISSLICYMCQGDLYSYFVNKMMTSHMDNLLLSWDSVLSMAWENMIVPHSTFRDEEAGQRCSQASVTS